LSQATRRIAFFVRNLILHHVFGFNRYPSRLLKFNKILPLLFLDIYSTSILPRTGNKN
jgi:hypothetical protein